MKGRVFTKNADLRIGVLSELSREIGTGAMTDPVLMYCTARSGDHVATIRISGIPLRECWEVISGTIFGDQFLGTDPKS